MHTVWVRLNAVVFFGLTVLLGLSCMAALSKVGHTLRQRPVVKKLEMRKFRSLKSHGGVDRALLSFDLDVDLTPAFHWNIKQLFVYVVAIYETNGRYNQVVLWDKIVEAGDSKVLKEKNTFIKYPLVDKRGGELRGKEVTLQLQWDHMPITGLLHMDKQPLDTSSKFFLPTEYQ
ncbi:signal peptidase complex subunit 3 [Fistulifera solaris]|uniref:Signal peptidase complex subunit 3 n=1 Tax=Fistulifera solaris TaxID=1519565 RepID=A0A1Z5K8Q8_FISSO|nr:signal peptidase complex subunit 3 [Fistulifera solaris]|eukprot:GAX22639.1 signal peptidase complex subunit 3 [Fistulifera solaris]